MATTPTANPVPSSAAADLLFNAEKIDEAVNTGATTYTDRRGVQRMTLAGAVSSIASFNSRGAWVTATAYAAKDLVLVSGTWYVAVAPHVSGATFVGDAAYWRVYQGVTLGELAAPTGPGLLGFRQAGANSDDRTVDEKLKDLDVSGADKGYVPGNVVAYAAGVYNDVVSELADQGKKLVLAPGEYLFDTGVTHGNGSRVAGAGSGYSDNATAFTRFVILDDDATYGLRVYDPIASYIEVELTGIQVTFATEFDHVTFAGNARRCFYFQSQLTNSKLDDLYALEGRHGYYTTQGFWSCNIGALSAKFCYMGAHFGGVGYSTSLDIRAVQIWQCFQGAYFSRFSYTNLNIYFDTCGLTAPARFRLSNEAPVMLALSEAKLNIGAMGTEKCNAIQVASTNFSPTKINFTRYDQPTANLWSYDAARALPAWLPGLGAITPQAQFMTGDSVLEVFGIASTLSGRAAALEDRFAASGGSLSTNNSITFHGCFIDSPSYTIDFPVNSTDPTAPNYARNIRFLTPMVKCEFAATSDLALVQCDERGIGAGNLTRVILRPIKRSYYLQKASGGTTLKLITNIRTGMNYFSASLLVTIQPSEAAGAARATAGVEEVLIEVRGVGATLTNVTAKRATGAVAVAIDGVDLKCINITGVANNLNFDVHIEETINRFCIADFPVSVVAT